MKPKNLKIDIYLDGAYKEEMLSRYKEGFVAGYTTNPTLMAKAGVKDYAGFCKEMLKTIHDKPISFEVFADDFSEMEKQANQIATWGKNVYVKIPIMNTKQEKAYGLIRRLFDKGIKQNITAIFTKEQLVGLREVMKPGDDAIISIFSGRIGDTGIDPEPLMREAVAMFKPFPQAKILWASPREVLNIYQADRCGCHIITATNDIIAKLKLHGKDLTEYSLDTVKMFYEDGKKAGFQL